MKLLQYSLISLIFNGCVSLKTIKIHTLETDIIQYDQYNKNHCLISETYIKNNDTLHFVLYDYDENNRLIRELRYQESILNDPSSSRHYLYKDKLKYEVYTNDTIEIKPEFQTERINKNCIKYTYIETSREIVSCYKNKKILSSHLYLNNELIEFSTYQYGKNNMGYLCFNSDSALIDKEVIELDNKGRAIKVLYINILTNEVYTSFYEYEFW